MFRIPRAAIGAAALCILAGSSASAQLVNDINGLRVRRNVFQFDPGTALTVTANPGGPVVGTTISPVPTSVVIDERGFTNNGSAFQANRHDLLFSSDGGTTSRPFLNQQPFDLSVDVTLLAGSNTPTKEAGFRINNNGFDGLFVVKTDTHEIAAFAGGLPYYSFTLPLPDGSGVPDYDSGETVNLRMVYTPPIFTDMMLTTRGTIQYVINVGGGPVSSPALEFGGNEGGIVNGSFIGVYTQAAGPVGNSTDFATTTFANFDLDGPPVVDDADFNDDDTVDGDDFLIWQRGLGVPNATFGQGDANHNQIVDAADLAIWKNQFGMGGMLVSAVPEPRSLALLLMGVAVLSRLRLVLRPEV